MLLDVKNEVNQLSFETPTVTTWDYKSHILTTRPPKTNMVRMFFKKKLNKSLSKCIMSMCKFAHFHFSIKSCYTHIYLHTPLPQIV